MATLHEEMERVLRQSSGEATLEKIRDKIDYITEDGNPPSKEQIVLRAAKHPDKFEIIIRLRDKVRDKK